MQPAAGPVAHGMIGRELEIADLDATYAALLGVPRDAALGRPAIEFMHPDDRDAGALFLRRVWADGETLAATQRHLHADGTIVGVTVHVARLGSGDDQRLVVTCRPLPPPDPHRTTVEAQWQMARLLLQALDGGKRAFGDTLIGNPATEILLLAYVAEAEARAIEARELAARINVTWSLAQRWLAALTDSGFIEPERPGPIERDTPVRLSPRALMMIEAIFASLVAVARDALAPP